MNYLNSGKTRVVFTVGRKFSVFVFEGARWWFYTQNSIPQKENVSIFTRFTCCCYLGIASREMLSRNENYFYSGSEQTEYIAAVDPLTSVDKAFFPANLEF